MRSSWSSLNREICRVMKHLNKTVSSLWHKGMTTTARLNGLSTTSCPWNVTSINMTLFRQMHCLFLKASWTFALIWLLLRSWYISLVPWSLLRFIVRFHVQNTAVCDFVLSICVKLVVVSAFKANCHIACRVLDSCHPFKRLGDCTSKYLSCEHAAMRVHHGTKEISMIKFWGQRILSKTSGR